MQARSLCTRPGSQSLLPNITIQFVDHAAISQRAKPPCHDDCRRRKAGISKPISSLAIGRTEAAVPAIGNLASFYTRTGQASDAIAAWQYGIRTAPEEASFYLNLATLYVRTGSADKARQTIQSLLVRQPSNAAALRALRELER